MKTHRFETQIWLPHRREQVFRFFADPINLNRLTPAWLHFEMLTPPAEIRHGSLLDYRLRLRGIPVRWQSQIEVWEPPQPFRRPPDPGPLFALGA